MFEFQSPSWVQLRSWTHQLYSAKFNCHFGTNKWSPVNLITLMVTCINQYLIFYVGTSRRASFSGHLLLKPFSVNIANTVIWIEIIKQTHYQLSYTASPKSTFHYKLPEVIHRQINKRMRRRKEKRTKVLWERLDSKRGKLASIFQCLCSICKLYMLFI